MQYIINKMLSDTSNYILENALKPKNNITFIFEYSTNWYSKLLSKLRPSTTILARPFGRVDAPAQ